MKRAFEETVSILMTATARDICQFISFVSIAALLAAECLAEPAQSITDCERKALKEMYGTYVYGEPRMPPSEPRELSVEETYGKYEYSEVSQSQLSAQSYTGTTVSIDPTRFEGVDGVVVNPYYVISCYRTFVEGHIPVRRWSNEDGFGVDRKVVDVLAVYPPGDIHRQSPIRMFEIVGEDLWYGGFTWLYIARRKE